MQVEEERGRRFDLLNVPLLTLRLLVNLRREVVREETVIRQLKFYVFNSTELHGNSW